VKNVEEGVRIIIMHGERGSKIHEEIKREQDSVEKVRDSMNTKERGGEREKVKSLRRQ
jgi:hypothetical protein